MRRKLSRKVLHGLLTEMLFHYVSLARSAMEEQETLQFEKACECILAFLSFGYRSGILAVEEHESFLVQLFDMKSRMGSFLSSELK